MIQRNLQMLTADIFKSEGGLNPEKLVNLLNSTYFPKTLETYRIQEVYSENRLISFDLDSKT